jgi:lipopolysaccharide export LptBFGC system permease protein LptF
MPFGTPGWEAAMTLEQMQAEIENLRQEQQKQRKFWRRWGLVSSCVSLVLVAVIFARLATTGADPASPMIFIVLTFVFLALAFGSAGRGYSFP